MRLLKYILVGVLAATLLGGCVYKIDIQQGNDLTEKQVSSLQTGMNRDQVRSLLGTPLVDDPFRSDRWDYFYAFKAGRSNDVERRRISLLFNDNILVAINGGLETEVVRAREIELDDIDEGLETASEADVPKPGIWDRLSEIAERLE
ncbi:MAG: hypothetical protein DHS20C01_04560 [marine bacterium B5-7]|nr:MAG: hypothetical protein DHS20C01_04560 [marine bacterium B5-7]